MESTAPSPDPSKNSVNQDKDDVFSDSEAEESGSSKGRRSQGASSAAGPANTSQKSEAKTMQEETSNIAQGVKQVSLKSESGTQTSKTDELKNERNVKSPTTLESPKLKPNEMSEFKAIAADASVFSFGDEDDYESE